MRKIAKNRKNSKAKNQNKKACRIRRSVQAFLPVFAPGSVGGAKR
jgi:hypothetical protein